MKKVIKDNKGYMLVEVIITSAIALIMAYFLIDITIKIVNKNNDYYIDSVLLTDKNIVTKEIMDDINSKKLIKAEKINTNQVKLTYADNTVKNLTVDTTNKTITYGSYKKKLSKELNITGLTITNDTTNKIITISIPAYTNYSKENYGINIVASYKTL